MFEADARRVVEEMAVVATSEIVPSFDGKDRFAGLRT
jgi:hypothetical protein